MKSKNSPHTVCWLCLGSNEHGHERIAEARRRLQALPGDISFAPPEVTEAIGLPGSPPFVNQVARLTTPLSEEVLRNRLKDIEREGGRLPGDKAQGVVRIDIDLLAYGDHVLKPDDAARDYVRRGREVLERDDTDRE